MRILFLTRLFHPHIGGVEKHVYKLSKQLQKDGYEVTILTTNFNGNLNSREKLDGVEIIRFNHPKPCIK